MEDDSAPSANELEEWDPLEENSQRHVVPRPAASKSATRSRSISMISQRSYLCKSQKIPLRRLERERKFAILNDYIVYL